MASSETIPADTHVIQLAPFTFFAGAASRIVGLGGNEPASDPAYAFHTPYGSVKTGLTTFVVRFQGLRASVGNLTLLINAMSPLAGSVARTVKLSAHPLRDIALTGELTATISAKAHLSYAVLGFVYGPTNASAEALEIEAYQIDTASAPDAAQNEMVFTEFGDTKMRQVSLLASAIPATLAHPVSQTPSKAQYLEPAFAHWSKLLGRPQSYDEETWARAYVLSVLDCYGMMADGASGCGLCIDGQSVHDALLACGSGSTLRAEVADDLPASAFSNQDFSWSIDMAHKPPIDVISRVDMMLEPLKIGGICVCVMAYDANDTSGNWSGNAASTTRSDFDRLILRLLTAGHDVGQVKIEKNSSHPLPTCIGIVIRKGRSTFY